MDTSSNIQFELRAELDDRIAERDRIGAVNAALSAVRSGRIDIDSLYARVLTPLLIDTGAGWHAGTVQVWQEHFATATVRTIVEGLYPDVVEAAAKASRRSERALLVTPPGEHHDLGLRMLADRLELAGWDVTYLGADTPANEIMEAARAIDADLVTLSVATHYNRVLLRETVDYLKAELPSTRIGVGGPAFAHDGSWPDDEVLTFDDLGLNPPKGA